jgi:hypothetical protein
MLLPSLQPVGWDFPLLENVPIIYPPVTKVQFIPILIIIVIIIPILGLSTRRFTVFYVE